MKSFLMTIVLVSAVFSQGFRLPLSKAFVLNRFSQREATNNESGNSYGKNRRNRLDKDHDPSFGSNKAWWMR